MFNFFNKIFFELSFYFEIYYPKLPISAKEIFLESMVTEPRTLYEIFYYYKKSYGIEVSLKNIENKIKLLYRKGYIQMCFPPDDYTKRLTSKQVNAGWFELSEKGEKYCIDKNLIDC